MIALFALFKLHSLLSLYTAKFDIRGEAMSLSFSMNQVSNYQQIVKPLLCPKGWLAIAKLIPLSLFMSLLLMPNEAFDNVKIEK